MVPGRVATPPIPRPSPSHPAMPSPYTPPADYFGTITVGVTATDTHGASDTSTFTVNVAAVNDAPVITNGPVTGSVLEAGDADTFVNASWDGAAVRPESNYTPSTTVIADALLAMLGSDTTAGTESVADVLDLIQADLPATSTRADAILAVWDYLDSFYTSGDNYYHVGHNTAAVNLAIQYVNWITLSDGAPLTDVIAKYTEDGSGNVTRSQSIHDNLLGNFGLAGLSDRFSGQVYDPVDGTNSTGIYEVIFDAGYADMHARPYYGGAPANPEAARIFDMAHGLVPVSAGQLTATDADHDDLNWSILADPLDPDSDTGHLDGQYGTLHVDADGKWRYVLDNARLATQSLGEGDHGDPEVFTVQVDDGNGGTATTTITINVTGSNDAPVIDAAVDGAVFAAVEDTAIESGSTSVADILAAAITDIDGDAVSVTLTLTYGPWSGGDTPDPETITIAPGDAFSLHTAGRLLRHHHRRRHSHRHARRVRYIDLHRQCRRGQRRPRDHQRSGDGQRVRGRRCRYLRERGLGRRCRCQLRADCGQCHSD
ncbi:hypothetical protein FPZ08_08025 [Devosia ginsengisoli]|uniref:Cadherin domain-containing protein n=1 Tax=Devosia ginsengisoli TaxID=400770 RepID=A0A5B8LRD3_9HYPH|nr:hypothetical protein FPZ08_08025 [Devosia ginsengisoli]